MFILIFLQPVGRSYNAVVLQCNGPTTQWSMSLAIIKYFFYYIIGFFFKYAILHNRD